MWEVLMVQLLVWATVLPIFATSLRQIYNRDYDWLFSPFI